MYHFEKSFGDREENFCEPCRRESVNVNWAINIRRSYDMFYFNQIVQKYLSLSLNYLYCLGGIENIYMEIYIL